MHTTSRWIVCLLACLASSGCASFDLKRAIPWGEGADGKLKAPVKVVAFWTDSVMQRQGETPMRGFAGRMMFYEDGSDKPIKVEGALDVYAYDEVGRDPTNLVPDRKFCFAADQMQHHYSKGSLGHSYSFWLPWDQAGGEKREISLIVRFVSTDGGIIMGEQAKYVLPGPEPIERSEAPRLSRFGIKPVDSEVRQADYEAGEYENGSQTTANFEREPNGEGRKLQTTTIPLPRRFGQRPPTAVVRPRTAPTAPTNVESPSPDANRDAARPSRHRGPQRRRPFDEPIGPIEGRRARPNDRHDRAAATERSAQESSGADDQRESNDR